QKRSDSSSLLDRRSCVRLALSYNIVVFEWSITMLMQGKLGLVVGVANKRSIAWAIAQRVADQGAQLALSYQNERLGENVRELAETVTNPLLLPLDVSDDNQIESAFARIRDEWGKLDFVVHAVAYAPKQEL